MFCVEIFFYEQLVIVTLKVRQKRYLYNKNVALQAIKRTIHLGGSIKLASASIPIKGGRKCLQACLPLRTESEKLRYSVYGCKVVYPLKGDIHYLRYFSYNACLPFIDTPFFFKLCQGLYVSYVKDNIIKTSNACRGFERK